MTGSWQARTFNDSSAGFNWLDDFSDPFGTVGLKLMTPHLVRRAVDATMAGATCPCGGREKSSA